MSVRVVRPGALTTVQDLGRWGLQRLGVVVGGPMDELAHRLANLLARNDEQAAALEITLAGPSLQFERTALIAVCGADLSPRVGEQHLPCDRAVLVRAGSRLDFAGRRSGCRAVLAVHGGVDVPPVLGSRATYLRGGFGGLAGRALRRGDLLPIGPGRPAQQFPGLAAHLQRGDAPFAALPGPRLAPPLRLAEPRGEAPRVVRIVPGRHWQAFGDEARDAFVTTPYRIAAQSDRMGLRLDGARLAPREPLQVVSEAVAFGTVQVPPDGCPIVLMADRQTTGGYPRLASVASVDLPLLAQALPGERVRFEPIALPEAQALDIARGQALQALARALDALAPPASPSGPTWPASI